MTQEEFDRQAEELRHAYERLLEEARELGISPIPERPSVESWDSKVNRDE